MVVPVVLQIDKSIIGWDSTVGAWCRLENHCVLGEDVQVKVRGAHRLQCHMQQ